jgi:membrane protein
LANRTQSDEHASVFARAYGLVVRFADGLFAHNAFEAAASIAFWFFLSLVPLLVFAGWILGSVARAKGVDYLVTPLIEIVPGKDAERLVAFELARMSGADGAPIAPLSIAGFLWTSSSGLHNLMDVFEIAVKVPRRPWWEQRVIALGWVIGGFVAAALAVIAFVRLDGLLARNDAAATGVKRLSMLMHTTREKTLAATVLLVFGTTLLAGFYRFAVEHPIGVRRRAWPGAFVAVATWLVISWTFGAYVSTIADYALYYGSLAAVAILLIWLYLTSFTLVLGAEVNAHLEGVR